jgi:hypothetical protein
LKWTIKDNNESMDDQALKQLAIQKEKEWLAVMQER